VCCSLGGNERESQGDKDDHGDDHQPVIMMRADGHERRAEGADGRRSQTHESTHAARTACSVHRLPCLHGRRRRAEREREIVRVALAEMSGDEGKVILM